MPTIPAKSTNQSSSEYQKLSGKELWNVGSWAFKFFFQIAPVNATIFIGASIVSNLLNSLGYAYISSRVLQKAIDLAQSPNAQISDIYPYLAVIAIYNVVAALVRFSYRLSRRALSFATDPEIVRRIYLKIQDLGIQTMDSPEINNKIHRANENLNSIMTVFEQVVQIITGLVTLTATLILLIGVLPFMIPAILLIALPDFFIDRYHRTKMYKFSYESTEARRKAHRSSNELTNVQKLSEIFVNGSYSFFDNRYSGFMKTYLETRFKMLKNWMTAGYGMGLLYDVISVVSYIILITRLIVRKLTVGDFYFQVRLVERFQDTLGMIMSTVNDISEVIIRLKDTYALFNIEPTFENGNVLVKPFVTGPEIEFKNVSFKYPSADKFLFVDLNLKIKSGEKIAIVGHNGAGKTTLVKLITRMYKADKGAVLVNGMGVDTLDSASYYKNLGVLWQDYNVHAHLTVKENIYLGNTSEPIDEVAIRLAAQQAEAMEFIDELPNKFDQILEPSFKGGIKPSTGQWQKIAIARFFYRNAPLLIFDEPTASIDAVAEYNIFNRIYEFFKGKTVIIISHKFSTVRNADRIIVVDAGKIIEEGTHHDLMALDGYYAKAFNMQAEGYKN